MNNFVVSINEPLNCIKDMCSEGSRDKVLLAFTELNEIISTLVNTDSIPTEKISKVVSTYGTSIYKENEGPIYIKASQIELKNYKSIFEDNSSKNYYFLMFIIFRRNKRLYVNHQLFL